MSNSHTSSTPRVLAITACPTGIAHTYMAAENLQAAAKDMGIDLRIETHGSIGVEGTFTDADIRDADAVVIAADTVIAKERFAGKPLVATGVDEAIKSPQQLLRRALSAQPHTASTATDGATALGEGGIGKQSPVSSTLFKALMNGVSHMIPFVVTGGLLIAVALSVGGTATAEGMSIEEGTFWYTLNELGALAFALMVPVLSGYIAVGIADRPGLAPGLITGMVATTGSLYGSEAGAGFLGGIITGILSGYVALAIKRIPVHKFIAPIWPIIVIPIFTTLIVGLLFIYLIGAPVAAAFSAMTDYLAAMQGSSVIVLGALIGAMIAFDMGGPFNKTAFLFGGGMIAAGNPGPMGMAACAIAVPPLAVGVATLVRRRWFNKAEGNAGIAALFMGFFGITEGAIPLAAARPLQVIPANVIGGAVAGALAGVFGAADHVMHGGPIVAVLGAVDNVAGYFLAMAIGVAVNAALILALVGVSRKRTATADASSSTISAGVDSASGASASRASDKGESSRASVATRQPVSDSSLTSADLVSLDEFTCEDCNTVVDELVGLAAAAGRISDRNQVVEAALAREDQHSTGVGHGVAIPHARVAGVTAPTLAFARLARPVVWAEGEEPTDLVFLITVPEDSGKTHLKLLSKLARHLMKEDFRAKLRHAKSAEEAVEVIDAALA